MAPLKGGVYCYKLKRFRILLCGMIYIYYNENSTTYLILCNFHKPLVLFLTAEGFMVGVQVGMKVGATVGVGDGGEVGLYVGAALGDLVGFVVGVRVLGPLWKYKISDNCVCENLI
jgi:hypothetical protein